MREFHGAGSPATVSMETAVRYEGDLKSNGTPLCWLFHAMNRAMAWADLGDRSRKMAAEIVDELPPEVLQRLSALD